MKRSRSRVALTALPLLALATGCGLSVSEYQAGQEVPAGNSDAEGEPAVRRELPQRNPTEEPGEERAPYMLFTGTVGSATEIETSAEVVPDAAVIARTGLEPCVADALASFGVKAYEPPIDPEASVQSYVDAFDGSRESFDNLLDALLSKIVNAEGLIDYAAVSPGGAYAGAFNVLTEALAVLSPVAEDTEASKVAFWVNAYNISMIRILVELGVPEKVPLDFVTGVFGSRKSLVAGVEVTLDQIEFRILKLANPRGREVTLEPSLQPAEKQPALHVALVCGAISCPKIRPFAYRGQPLNQILEENLYMFLNNDKLHFIAENGSYRVSTLLNWFAEDFELLTGEDKSFLAQRFVLPECRNDADSLIALFEGLTSFKNLQFVTYDWSVNSQ